MRELLFTGLLSGGLGFTRLAIAQRYTPASDTTAREGHRIFLLYERNTANNPTLSKNVLPARTQADVAFPYVAPSPHKIILFPFDLRQAQTETL